MALLTKENIIACKDKPTEVVSVPEWNGEVVVQCFSSKEREEIESALLEGKKEGETPSLINHRARVVALAIVDPEDNTKKMFSLEEIKILADKNATAIHRIYKAAIKLSKMRREDIEEAEKN